MHGKIIATAGTFTEVENIIRNDMESLGVKYIDYDRVYNTGAYFYGIDNYSNTLVIYVALKFLEIYVIQRKDILCDVSDVSKLIKDLFEY